MGRKVIPKQDRDPESIAHLNANLIKQQFLALKKILNKALIQKKPSLWEKKILIWTNYNSIAVLKFNNYWPSSVENVK